MTVIGFYFEDGAVVGSIACLNGDFIVVKVLLCTFGGGRNSCNI